jgi:hypothetical protein
MSENLECIVLIKNVGERLERQTTFEGVMLKKESSLDRSKWQNKEQ